MSANHGWLSWSIAVTGVLLVLTAICVIIFAPAGSPSRGSEREGDGADETSRDPQESQAANEHTTN